MTDVTRREAMHKMAATTGVGALLAATATVQAIPAESVDPYQHDAEGSEVHVEWGIVNKPKEGELTVKFRKGFAERPAVLLTPYWPDQAALSVKFVETLVHVGEMEFKFVSKNAADGYYISWVAIGKKRTE